MPDAAPDYAAQRARVTYHLTFVPACTASVLEGTKVGRHSRGDAGAERAMYMFIRTWC